MNSGGLLPSVFVTTGNPCSFLKVGTVNANDAPTGSARAEQNGFPVTAGVGDYVMVEFDVRRHGNFTDETATIILVVSPGGSAQWTPVITGSGWHHRQISVEAGATDVLVSIKFLVCDPETDNNVRMDIDNVEVSVSSTNPCPTPEDCDMVQSGSFQFCQGDADVTLERLGIGVPPCPCTADFNKNGAVDTPDFLQLLQYWTNTPGCYQEDLDCEGEGTVGATDLQMLLARWGPCSLSESPMGGSGSPGDLESALVLLGYADLAAYQVWLSQASEAEALASAYALAALLDK